MYIHLDNNNKIDMRMDNNPAFVFGKPYCDQFIEIADDIEFNIGDLYIDGKVIKQEPVVVIPQSITPRQIRMQLTNSNLRDTVEAMIKDSTDYILKDWWEYSLEYKIDNDILIGFAKQLGLTEADLDSMFIEASKL